MFLKPYCRNFFLRSTESKREGERFRYFHLIYVYWSKVNRLTPTMSLQNTSLSNLRWTRHLQNYRLCRRTYTWLFIRKEKKHDTTNIETYCDIIRNRMLGLRSVPIVLCYFHNRLKWKYVFRFPCLLYVGFT